MEIILDVQGFIQDRNRFVPKELASIPIRRLETDVSSVGCNIKCCLFYPPCEWSKLSAQTKTINAWMIRNTHRLPWDCGELAYQTVLRELNAMVSPASRVYVWGPEKKRWIEETIGHSKPVIDLSAWGCPSPQKLYIKVLECADHANYQIEPKRYHASDNTPRYLCAVENVQRLKLWFIKHQDKNLNYDCTSEDDDDDNSSAGCCENDSSRSNNIKNRSYDTVDYKNKLTIKRRKQRLLHYTRRWWWWIYVYEK